MTFLAFPNRPLLQNPMTICSSSSASMSFLSGKSTRTRPASRATEQSTSFIPDKKHLTPASSSSIVDAAKTPSASSCTTTIWLTLPELLLRFPSPRRPSRIHEKERTSSHALDRSPTTGLPEYMKRRCAQPDASSLTCRSGIVLWWYSGRTTCSADATLIMRPAGEGEVLEWRIGGVEELICRLPHSLSTHPLSFPFSGL